MFLVKVEKNLFHGILMLPVFGILILDNENLIIKTLLLLSKIKLKAAFRSFRFNYGLIMKDCIFKKIEELFSHGLLSLGSISRYGIDMLIKFSRVCFYI